MKYLFAVLDPRPVPAAQVANDKIFENPIGVLGIEVTIPELAARCTLGNIDPQHSGGDANRAAIEVVQTCKLPLDSATTLVTVRADLDSVGAMAILAMRAEGPEGVLAELFGDQNALYVFDYRVAQVAAADKFARGGWPGPRPLPSRDNPWPEEAASAESSRPLAAIAAAVADFKAPLATRVAKMQCWLLTGEEPVPYRDAVEVERQEMIVALESGAIKAETAADGRIAVVESTHRAATTVGYALAPVVVALNPAMWLGGGEHHRKFTVCQFEADKYVDLPAVLADLRQLEPGWGGQPASIIGSTQGVSSQLTIEQVVKVVKSHLL